MLEAKHEYDQDVERAQREPYVMNLRNPYDGEMKFELEDPYQHKAAFQKFRVQELAEDLGLEDHELVPSDEEPDVVPDGGMKWYEPIEEYWQAFEDFEERHPPRYVNPGKPIDHDTVDYFPHRHFQQNIRDFAESEEEYRDFLDFEVLRKHGIEPALE